MSLGPLGTQSFRRLWTAQVVSRLGDSVHEIALIFLAYETTGQPSIVAATVVASLVPSAVVSIPAGAVVDRYNRKWLLVGSELVRGGVVLLLPLFGRGGRLVPLLLLVAFIAGLMQAVSSPARSSLIPNLVEEDQLDAANGLSRTTDSIGRLLYAVGGGVVAVIGPFTAFYVDAASFLLSALLLTTLPGAACRPRSTAGSTPALGVVSSVRESVSILRERPVLRALVVLSGATAFALGPLGVVLPFFAETASRTPGTVGATDFGLLYAAVYGGLLLGSIGAGGLRPRLGVRRGPLVLGGLLALSLALAATAVLPTAVPAPMVGAAGGLLLAGAAVGVVQVPVSSIAQEAVPDEERGRLFGFMRVPALVAPPVSVVLAGGLLEPFGPAAVLVAEAALVVAVAGLLLRSPLAAPGDGSRSEALPWWTLATALAVGTTVVVASGTGTVRAGPVAVAPLEPLVLGWLGATVGAVGRTVAGSLPGPPAVVDVLLPAVIGGLGLAAAAALLPIAVAPDAIAVAVGLAVLGGATLRRLAGTLAT